MKDFHFYCFSVAFVFVIAFGLMETIAADTNAAPSQAQPDFISKDATTNDKHPEMAALSASLKDGNIFFIKGDLATYAVKAVKQSMSPEFISYEYLKVGSNTPILRAESTKGFPIEIVIDDIHVPWSGGDNGLGYLYLVNNEWGPAPRFKIGLPFITGDLEHFRLAVPSGVDFKSLPWELPQSDSNTNATPEQVAGYVSGTSSPSDLCDWSKGPFINIIDWPILLLNDAIIIAGVGVIVWIIQRKRSS